jgi:ribonuclease R
MMAERSAVDRFTASYLETRTDQEFTGRISGVTHFGLFVRLDENGADGLIPIKTLPDDYYEHVEKAHALIGRRTKRIFRLCAPVRVMIREADRLTGSCILSLAPGQNSADIPGFVGAHDVLPKDGPRGHRGGQHFKGKSKSDADKKPFKKKKKTTPKHKKKKEGK